MKRFIAGALLAMLAIAAAARAQYVPLTDNNGKAFHQALDARFGGAVPTSPSTVSSTYAARPSAPYLYENWIFTDASACSAGVAVTAGSGPSAACPVIWNGTAWMPNGATASSSSSAPGGAANSVQYNGTGAFAGVALGLDTLLQGSATSPQAVSVNNCSTALSYSTMTHLFGCSSLGNVAALNVGTSLVGSGGSLNLNMPGTALGPHIFATALSPTGTLSGAQPAFSDLSGSLGSGQLPALSGDCTTSGFSITCTKINGVTPGGTPAAHQFATNISSSAVPTYAQPAFTDISGQAPNAQIQNPTTGVNALTYGLNDTNTSASCTASSASAALTSCGANTFGNGSLAYVAVLHGGAPNSLGAPTGHLTATIVNGPGGTSSGAQEYSYCITTVDPETGESACSAIVAASSMPSALGANQRINVTWDRVSTAFGYKVYECTGTSGCSSTTAFTFVGYVYDNGAATATSCPGGGSCLGYSDAGWRNASGAAPPVSATRDLLETTISSGGGTASINLAAAVASGVSGSVTVVPDNNPVLSNASAALAAGTPNASTPAGGYVRADRGNYCLVKPFIQTSQTDLLGAPGSTIYATASDATGYFWGTTFKNCGQTDGLPLIIQWDTTNAKIHDIVVDNRCVGGANTNASGTSCSAGSQAQSMDCLYMDGDNPDGLNGTDDSDIEYLSCGGAHHGIRIGGSIAGMAYNVVPAGDVSGYIVNQFKYVTYNTGDENTAEGVIMDSANAFIQHWFDPQVIGNLAVGLDLMDAGNFDIQGPNCGIASAAAARTCVMNQSAVSGEIANGIDDSRPHDHTSKSYWQPATSYITPQQGIVDLHGNLFHNDFQLDKGSSVRSKGNTGNSTATWLLNDAHVTVWTEADFNQTMPCPWTYQTASTGNIIGCTLNEGNWSGLGLASTPAFPALALDPRDPTQFRIFTVPNYSNPSDWAFVPESAANSGVPANPAYTLMDLVAPSRVVGFGTATHPVTLLLNDGTTMLLGGATSGGDVIQAAAVAGSSHLTTPTTEGNAGESLASDAGAGTGYTWGCASFKPAALATYACSSTYECARGTQTDSAVACVAGVTAAAGGSTHCEIRCNGTNWIRTGL